jgi:hypothetical protein
MRNFLTLFSQDGLRVSHRLLYTYPKPIPLPGVIEFSFSTEYSQVLMVKKKPLDPALRFCLDFRRLNDATEVVDIWPIPNIKQMIERVGRRKPKYFGNMDLTAGNHQFSLAKNARIFDGKD